jgi:hypothetical protein
MAQIQGRGSLGLTVVFTMTEAEAGALDALIGYGADSFLEVFYKHMGKVYLEPYETGLRSLFEARGQLKEALQRAETARRVFSGQLKAIEPERLAELFERARELRELKAANATPTADATPAGGNE